MRDIRFPALRGDSIEPAGPDRAWHLGLVIPNSSSEGGVTPLARRQEVSLEFLESHGARDRYFVKRLEQVLAGVAEPGVLRNSANNPLYLEGRTWDEMPNVPEPACAARTTRVRSLPVMA
jgi:hypothetical protein